jgi:hypothetical protein
MTFNLDNFQASLDAMSKKEESEFLKADQFQPLVILEAVLK